MPVVLVNGNPETSAVWDPLVERLGRDDVERLSPPGFGAPLPAGFDCSPRGYRECLAGRLEAIGAPVDLVGHDIGGSAVVGVATTRPDLLRTWASDSLGVFHPDYRWHDLARTWQTPGAGERSVATMLGGDHAEQTRRMVEYGMPAAVAARVAAGHGAAMQRAVLSFYRAAAQPTMAELGRDLPRAAARPGLAVLGGEDHLVGSEALRREAAASAGAGVAFLPGAGHLWMLQDVDAAAQALEEHWTGAGGTPQA